jgi:hypothetical protein
MIGSTKMHSNMVIDSIMIQKARLRSSPDFRVEYTQLVIDQGYSVQSATAMGMRKFILENELRS